MVAHALDAGEFGSITPMGSCKAQASGINITLIPPEIAESLDFSHGSSIELGFHAESNTLSPGPDGGISGTD